MFLWTRRFISKCQLKNSSQFSFCQNTKAVAWFKKLVLNCTFARVTSRNSETSDVRGKSGWVGGSQRNRFQFCATHPPPAWNLNVTISRKHFGHKTRKNKENNSSGRLRFFCAVCQGCYVHRDRASSSRVCSCLRKKLQKPRDTAAVSLRLQYENDILWNDFILRFSRKKSATATT